MSERDIRVCKKVNRKSLRRAREKESVFEKKLVRDSESEYDSMKMRESVQERV